MSGGICTDCINHDVDWKRISHDVKLGGIAQDPMKKDIEIGVDGRVKHHRFYRLFVHFFNCTLVWRCFTVIIVLIVRVFVTIVVIPSVFV